jgi:MFS family permease
MIWPSVEDERIKALDARLGRKSTSAWKSNGMILSIVFFVLTALGITAFALLFRVPIFDAIVCVAVAEFLIQKKRFFGTGIESGLWAAALTFILIDLPHTGEVEALLAIALAAAIVGLRMRNAFFGAIAAALVVAYAGAKWDDPWPAVVVALAIAFACVIALTREWKRRSTEDLFAFGAVLMPLAAYATPLIRHEGKPQLSLAAVFAIFGAAMLVVAIKRRDRATMISAAIALAVASVEARDLIHASVEVKLMIAGALLIAIAAALSRALRDATSGFVTTPSSMTRYDEAMQLAGTFSVAHATPQQTPASPHRESGGGSFGGAGSSGEY